MHVYCITYCLIRNKRDLFLNVKYIYSGCDDLVLTCSHFVLRQKSDGSTSSNGKLSEKSATAPPEAVKVEKKEEPKEDIAVIPMSWGSGRSFAQVLKKEEQSL